MPCEKCQKLVAERPSDSALAHYPSRCESCIGQHDWVKMPMHRDKLFCRLCKVSKREIGINNACPGKPPWSTIL